MRKDLSINIDFEFAGLAEFLAHLPLNWFVGADCDKNVLRGVV